MEEMKNKYQKLSGQNSNELSKVTLLRFINWYLQSKEHKINWKKLEKQFLEESKTAKTDKP